ncbi:MAG: hypothetical protein IJ615_07760 [Bacteroidaceae bacterium]|nr:hypothetical protein [Bacteroidaceae bacterium]
MKKKLIQSLTLLLVAVCVGAFVSCKDTNEDLYNEYRAEAAGQSLTLQQKLEELEGKIADLKSCTCDMTLANRVETLEGLVAALGGGGSGSVVDILDDYIDDLLGGGSGSGGLTLEDIISIVNNLQGDEGDLAKIYNTLETYGNDITTILTTLQTHGDNIQLLLTNQAAAQELLASTIEDLTALQEKVNNIKQCECDFTTLWNAIHDLEAGLAAAEAKAQNAMDLATAANTTANEAKLTADEAKTAADAATTIANAATDLAQKAVQTAANAEDLAKAAGLTAQEAKDFAESAKASAENALTIANNAISVATTAQTTATAALDQANANKEAIDQLKNDIQIIQTTLTQYGDQINLNTTNIQKNADAIADAVNKIETNAANIQKNADAIADLQTQITTVSQTAAEALQKAIDADAKAEANKLAIDNLKPAVEANTAAITELQKKTQTLETNVTNLQTAVNNLTTQVENNTTAITNLNNTVNNLTNQVNTIESTVNDLKTTVEQHTTQIAQLQQDLADAKAECAANLATAKAYTDAEIAAAKTAILAEVATMLENYYTKDKVYTKEEVDALLDQLDVKIEGNTVKITTLDGRVSTLETTVDGHTSSINAINEEIEFIKQHLCECEPVDLTDILQRLTDAEGNIGKNTEEIEKIKQEIADVINKNIEELAEKYDDLKTVIDNLKYVTPEELDDVVDALVAKAQADSTAFKERMDVIGDSVKTAFQDIIDLKTLVNTLESTTVKIDDYTADKEEILNKIDANTTKIEDVQDAVDAIQGELDALQDELDELNDRMDVAEANIEQALEDIQDLKDEVSAVQEFLAKQVTGIIIQSTYNPAFGTLDLPFDVQSNILVAYYGKPKNDVEFPTSRTSNYVRPEEALTEKDMEMINGVEVFEHMANIPLMFENNYAGKVYMTINPNTADLTGLELSIVNTQDTESPIKLEGVKKSTEKLKFGYTRGDNGFYEAEAVVAPVDVEKVDRIAVDKAALKEAYNEIAKNRLNANISQVATDFYKFVKSVKLNKSGLKCSYTENGNTHSVYSNYNLAATAIDPLDFASYKDLNYQTVPGYARVNKLLDRISNRVNNEVHVFFKNLNGNGITEKLANLEIKKIVVKDLSEDLLAKFDLEINEDFEIEGLSYHLQLNKVVDVPVKFDKELSINLKGLTIPINIQKDVEVDLTGVEVNTPTVVVTGKASGEANAGAEIDPVTSLPVRDPVTNEIVLKTILVVPIYTSENPAPGETPVGYAQLDLEDIKVNADINASGTAGDITLNGNPVAHVEINQDVTIDDDRYVTYDLHVDETFQTTINIDEWFYFGDNGTDKKTFHFEKTISMRNAVEELWGNAQDAIGSVNTMLDQLRDLVDAVNSALNQINSYEDKITSTVDSYIDRVRSYIDRINSKIVGFVNNTNSRFQPFMVAADTKGIKNLSGSKNYPTLLTKEISLYPTSKTMELLVPIARKHVAVTNVFKGEASAQGGDADCQARLKDANTGKLNTVLDGNIRQIALSGLKSGYVYEIAYSGLDFHGNIATRKYYVSVK